MVGPRPRCVMSSVAKRQISGQYVVGQRPFQGIGRGMMEGLRHCVMGSIYDADNGRAVEQVAGFKGQG